MASQWQQCPSYFPQGLVQKLAASPDRHHQSEQERRRPSDSVAKRPVFKYARNIPLGLLETVGQVGKEKKEGIGPAVLDRAEPEKYDLGKTMTLFILLGWHGLGRHCLRLTASFILPHCSIKFYSLHLQSKSFHITLSAFFDPCDWKDGPSAPLRHQPRHRPRHNQF